MAVPARRPTPQPTTRPRASAAQRPATAGHRTAAQQNQVCYVDLQYVYREWLDLQVRAGRLKREDVHAFWQTHGSASLSSFKSFFPALKDVYDGQITVRLIVKELGIKGTFYEKAVKGRPHIIFRGFAGGRQFLTANSYGVQHHKVIHLKLGKAGLKSAAKGGLIFGLLLVTFVDIVDFATRDNATWGGFLGTLGMDVVKCMAATGAGYAAGVLTAAAMGTAVIAIGPIIAAIAVGVVLGFVLDSIDNKYDISGRLGRLIDRGLAKLAQIAEELENDAVATYRRVENSQMVRDLSREAHELVNWAGNHMPRIQWTPFRP